LQKVKPMEQPREQQAPVGSAPYPYPYPPQYQQPGYAAPAPRPSVWRVLSSFMRLIMRRLIYGLVWVLRPLRPHAGFVVIIVGLLSVIGWMGSALWGQKLAEPADPRAAALAPAAAVENYLTGRRSFNADMMWDAYSTNYQAEALQSGGSKATVQAIASQEKRIGLQYSSVQYIGGVVRNDGGHFYYYSVDVGVASSKIRLPIVFMTDRDEKIEFIISPLDDVVQRLLQQ
jgi:hypothetical protein